MNIALLNSTTTDKDDSVLKIFIDAMDDDFNSAKVFAELFTLCAKLGKFKDHKFINSLKYAIDEFKDILGVFRKTPEKFINGVKNKYLNELNLEESYIQNLIEQRNAAKQEKNYAAADQIRAELDQKGIMLKDSPQGTTWDIKQLY